MSGDCDLCEAAPLTPRLDQGPSYWIAECESCGVPMVVWRVHDADPPGAVRVALWHRLARVANQAYGPGRWHIDDHLRTIPDHYHAHARPTSSRWEGAGADR